MSRLPVNDQRAKSWIVEFSAREKTAVVATGDEDFAIGEGELLRDASFAQS